jgi:hypothetical protein
VATEPRRSGTLAALPVTAGGELPLASAALRPDERASLVRRAKLLAWGGNAWHFVEFLIAVGAGIAAGSIALVGFGFDSLIESVAGFIILWRFAASRARSPRTPSGARSS